MYLQESILESRCFRIFASLFHDCKTDGINDDCMLLIRRQSYEGLALKQIHLEQITSLIRRCRRFFPSTAAVEIWNEFRY